MGEKKKEVVCDVTNVNAASAVFGGSFRREDCGFFETCSHHVEEYNSSLNAVSPVVGISYCAVDWMKVGPLVAVIILVIVFLYMKLRRVGSSVPERIRSRVR